MWFFEKLFDQYVGLYARFSYSHDHCNEGYSELHKHNLDRILVNRIRFEDVTYIRCYYRMLLYI